MCVYRDVIIGLLKRETSIKMNAWDTIGDDDNLSFWGFTSMDVVKLVVAIEERFQFTLDNDELLMENFATINKINDILKKYIKG